ncbi:expressed unknown protein [Seminavis robusta]|uniref:G-protein coupled receptors family 2 profile 2 domain-containing protein n=1 Tax=Seminavis robusta TaxID=568900 RepID=A0A9N8F2T7_9STRA|nr:expressed unknown protein [Seminavis robusta]|eukprot:Sro2805_g337500.1 n/a (504) ;mRNA; f:2407-3918
MTTDYYYDESYLQWPSMAPTLLAEDVSSLSEAQDKALSIVPLCSGIMSAWGSGSIIYMVCKAEKWNSYKRIMLGLSVFDCISSLAIGLQPFFLPADSSQRVWAVGTDATCTLGGFFQQLSLANIWYNGFLSFFFLFTIRYQMSEERMSKRYEPVFHIIAIGHPLVTAIMGAAIGAYGELKLGHNCWLTNYPDGCVSCQGSEEKEDPNAQCCLTPVLAYVYAAIPTFFVLLAVIINNLLIYCHMRKIVHQTIMSANATDAVPSTNSAISNYGNLSAEDSGPAVLATVPEEGEFQEDDNKVEETPAIGENGESQNDVNKDTAIDAVDKETTIASDSNPEDLPFCRQNPNANNPPAATTTMNGSSIAQKQQPTIEPNDLSTEPQPPVVEPSSSSHPPDADIISNVKQIQEQQRREELRNTQLQKIHDARQTKRLREVAVQAFLYVAGFLLTQLPVMLLGIMASSREYTAADDADLFPMLLLRAILWPLQGLFNYCVWIRPSYLRET